MIYDIIIVKEGAFMSNRFHIVKKYIDQMDYYDLLASGAPSDEFDIESKEISVRIRDDHSVQDIAEIIALVFNKLCAVLSVKLQFIILPESWT